MMRVESEMGMIDARDEVAVDVMDILEVHAGLLL